MNYATFMMAITLLGLQTLANGGGDPSPKLNLTDIKINEEPSELDEGDFSIAKMASDTRVKITNVHSKLTEPGCKKVKLPLKDILPIEEEPEVFQSNFKVGFYPNANRQL